MAKLLVNLERGIEISAEDALKWLTHGNKSLRAAPAVIAALAILIDILDKPLADLAGVATNPLNIPLDLQTAAELVAVWPEVKAFISGLGVKF